MSQPATPNPRSSNLTAGVVAGVVAAVVGAVLYAAIFSIFDATLSLFAILVGVLVGFAVGRVGGADVKLPPIAAVLGVVGAFLGDFFYIAHVGAKAITAEGEPTSSISLLTGHTNLIWEAYTYAFDVKTALFYIVAGVAGFRLASRPIEQQRLAAARATQAQTPPAYGDPAAPSGTGAAPVDLDKGKDA